MAQAQIMAVPPVIDDLAQAEDLVMGDVTHRAVAVVEALADAAEAVTDQKEPVEIITVLGDHRFGVEDIGASVGSKTFEAAGPFELTMGLEQRVARDMLERGLVEALKKGRFAQVRLQAGGPILRIDLVAKTLVPAPDIAQALPAKL